MHQCIGEMQMEWKQSDLNTHTRIHSHLTTYTDILSYNNRKCDKSKCIVISYNQGHLHIFSIALVFCNITQ